MTIELHILHSRDDPALEHIRQFFRNHVTHPGGESSGLHLDQAFCDLPGEYSMPRGRLIFAEKEGQPAGYVGIRPLSDGMCEMKRLYVTPEMRGQGLGMRLACAAIQAAKETGYHHIMLNALPHMRMAVKLYRELGFHDAPACYPSPVEDALYMTLELKDWSEADIRNENLAHLFDFNRAWSRQMQILDPGYFEKLSRLQNPEYLWNG
jgi:carbonic anhydrase